MNAKGRITGLENNQINLRNYSFTIGKIFVEIFCYNLWTNFKYDNYVEYNRRFDNELHKKMNIEEILFKKF